MNTKALLLVTLSVGTLLAMPTVSFAEQKDVFLHGEFQYDFDYQNDSRYPEIGSVISKPFNAPKSETYGGGITFSQLVAKINKFTDRVHKTNTYSGPYSEELGPNKRFQDSGGKMTPVDPLRNTIQLGSTVNSSMTIAPYHIHCQFRWDGKQYQKPSYMYIFKAVFRYKHKTSDYHSFEEELGVFSRKYSKDEVNKLLRAEVLTKVIPINKDGKWAREDRGNNFNYRYITPWHGSTGINSEVNTYPYARFQYKMPNGTTKNVLASPIGFWHSYSDGKLWKPGC